MDRQFLQQQTTTVLEWDRLLAVLAGQARSAMGIEGCRTLPLERDLASARARLQETAEMVALLESTDPFPALGFPDLRDPLGRTAKGALLETHELRDLAVVLGLVGEATRYVRRHREDAPQLWMIAEPLEAAVHLHRLDQTRAAIERCVDPEGNIRESATPDLRRLMEHAKGLKQTMRHRLEGILASKRYAEVLQERYFAQREGRYVVPIKAEMRTKIPGIVHDVSASGATVFLEPRELVELNNAVKVADLEVDREVKRILQELSALVAQLVPVLLDCLAGLARLDCITAKAGLSRLVGGQPVVLNDSGRVLLRKARHPLLVLARDHVVANDLTLEEPVRVLVISGPNTGGKTVTLKILGLFALMVRAGLQPSCGADSEMALFQQVYADIGDAQDLTKDLSSFSAHMTQMVTLLELAAAQSAEGHRTSPGTLVLLDEPVTSTDPAEGAALAEALLLRLANLGVKVVVTTHYNSLKALAQTTPGFLNASVEFDIATLSPTYRLFIGIPGGSSAIEIAGRLGMDESILEQAVSLLRREDLSLEQMLSELQDKQRRLDQDVARIAQLKAESDAAAQEAKSLAERLRQSEREDRKAAKKKVTEELLHARAEIQSVLDGLKRERTLLKAREAKERVADIEAQVRTRLVPASESVPLERLKAGDRVEILGLGAIGTLLESPEQKKRVRVRVGDTEMSVGVTQLAGLLGTEADSTSGSARRAPTRPGPSSRPWPRAEDDTETVLDLRGKTAEEAVEMTISALDRATLGGASWVRVIHGHGTGRLKAVLRNYLKESPYVARFRPGERGEGGDGVTVVELKAS